MQAPLPTDINGLNAGQDRLWDARLAREKRALAHYARTQGRPNIPAVVVRALLRVTGLYEHGLRNAADIQLTRVELRCPKLPQSLMGFRVLHLSDFHFRKDASLERLCGMLAGVECDLCVMTGDFAYTARQQHDYLPDVMRPVVDSIRATHGIFAILGNHDHADDVDRLSAVGIPTLINQGQALSVGNETVWLAGVDDPHDFHTHDLARAMEGAPADAFKILLAHSPELVEEAAAREIDLYLCGHTHGGQLCLPWGPVFLNVRCARKYGFGSWQYDAMRGITTTGLGATAIPVRYNCPPEIVLIELAKE
jgi:hypothetical protein